VKVALYSSRIQFSGDTLEKQGLGGSESALINISQSWKKQYPKDEIVVFNGKTIRCKEYNGVVYKSTLEFRTEIISNRWDAFISLRECDPFLNPFINAKIKCFWSQDDMNEIDLQKARDRSYIRENIDLFFVLSNHSLNDIFKSFPEKDIVIQRNGYRSDWINNSNNNRKPIAIYTSTPFRGLDVLAEVWEDIYNGCAIKPELRVFSGMGLYQQNDTEDLMKLYHNLSKLPNVHMNQPIPQFQLYKELQQAKVMLYPNHFLETCSMAVLEALANGVWVVTTNLGALGEQVKNNVNGYIIDGYSKSPEYKQKFIEEAIKALETDQIPNSNGLIFSWNEQARSMRQTISERIN